MFSCLDMLETWMSARSVYYTCLKVRYKDIQNKNEKNEIVLRQ